MKQAELEFRNILQVLDPDFANFLMETDYALLEADGLTKINNFTFRRDYWSKPIDQVTINPNANLGNIGQRKSFCNLLSEMSAPLTKLSSLALVRKYGNRRNFDGDRLVKAIIEGQLYFHNLTLFDLSYCVGLSLYPLLENGLDFFEGLKSNPPRRPSSFVTQVVRYIQYASNLFAGAIALTDFFPNYSYYTMMQESYSDKQRENDLQNLVHGLSDEVRLSGQSPFTNISVVSPATLRGMLGNYLWGNSYQISHLMDEVMHNQELYARFFGRGMIARDGKPLGVPYRFPITTLVADASFEKEYPEVWNEVIASNANLCYLNIVNNFNTDLKALSMCCRLTMNIEDMLKVNVNNTFGSYLTVGSHAVVSINLPRIAYEAKHDETRFMEILRERLEECRRLLLIHREDILENRRLKYNYFFRTGKISLKRNMFSTIGFIGFANAIEIMLNDEKTIILKTIMNEGGLALAKKILTEMKEASVCFSREDGYMYNIEEVPGETASGALANKDRMLAGGDYEYYDTQFVPTSYDISIFDKIGVEGELQGMCTGGSIAHLNVEGIASDSVLTSMTKSILQKSKLTHFAMNKGFTVCKNSHTVQGIVPACPVCGASEVDWITRIVGYFVPVRAWNKTKQAEFNRRKWLKLEDRATFEPQ
jgi:ribonucleoside-triphosphate reductase